MLGDTTPSVVSTHSFSAPRQVADAVAHEVGHQLGLAHQSTWVGSTKTAEYDAGNEKEAPIMGHSYEAQKATWIVGINSFGLQQDDTAIISKTFKRIH